MDSKEIRRTRIRVVFKKAPLIAEQYCSPEIHEQEKTKDTEQQQPTKAQPPPPPPLDEKKRKITKVEVDDAMFNKTRKKKMMNQKMPQEISLLVEKAMALLEVAVEEDAQLNRLEKPATKKIQMLPLLNDFLSKKHLQGEFLDHGVLTLLKNWLEPLPDGSLPNPTVRASILKILTDIFPIDIQREDRREQLKQSGLGKAIMFLSKTEEEIPSNKKLAKDLIENWSRAIYNKSTNFSDLRLIDKENMVFPVKKLPVLLKQQAPMMEADLDFDSSIINVTKPIHQGQQQQRASKPEATPSVYLVRPQSNIKLVGIVDRKQQVSGRRAQIEKNLKKMKASNKRPLQATKVSAQGRGVFTCL